MTYNGKVEVAQLCLTLCNLMDCSLQGSSVHGILQARILEWVAVPFSRNNRKESEYTYIKLNHFATHLKLTHCKLTIVQQKQKELS